MNNFDKVKMAMLSVQRYPWEQGVCMQAMYEAGEIEVAVAMAHDAVLRQQPDGRLAVINDNIAVTDPASNGIVVRKAYDITGDKMYLEAANKMLSYLMRVAPRTEEDILCHNEISFVEGFSPNQIWADSIYMAPPFLASMGEIDEAYKQIEGIINYLKDKKTGLIRHIYDATNKAYVRDKLWATGNGWALMGIAAVTDIATENSRNDIADRLITMSQDIFNGMLKFILEDGRFHDCLDEAESFVDGASAMMFATYMYRSISNNTLSREYIKYADMIVDTMEEYVDEYGIIHGVCGCPHFISEGTSAESMAAYIMMHAWKNKATRE